MEQGTRGNEQGFKRLRAWQKADDLACSVFHLLVLVPAHCRWLSDQLGRAAISVPANIAEGYSRGGLKDYLRFLDIARGSLAEVEYYLHFLQRTGIATPAQVRETEDLRLDTGNLLFGLTESLRAKVRSEGEWQRGMIREEFEEYSTVLKE